MIRARTVFVLGAGASKPYGFPVGAELVDHICNEILSNPPTALRKRLADRRTGRDDAAVAFAGALRGSRAYSIDAFLETNHRFLAIGKAAIADVLLRAEVPERLDAVDVEEDWYRYLFNTLVRRDPEHYRAQARKLSIITFNFDRSFERALFSALRNSFDLTEEQARPLTREVEIHHVHGCLGEPEWLSPDHADANPYRVEGDSNFRTAIEKAVRKIKIVHEEISRSVIEDLQVPLQQAQRVYFIGFGFDERNLERLGSPGIFSPTADIRATALGKTSGELQPLERRFGEDHKIHLYPDLNALALLRHREALFD